MSSRILWWKRARKSHGVRSIECLMRDILAHTNRIEVSYPKPPRLAVVHRRRRGHNSSKSSNDLHLLKRKLRSKQKLMERKKHYARQLDKEKRRTRSAKQVKRFLKRLNKYNTSMTRISEELNTVKSHLEGVDRLIINQKRSVTTDIVKQIRDAGTCAYCNNVCERLSREHLLPRSAGGRAIIGICFPCNFKRGSRGDFGPFLAYIRTYPHHWTAALASTKDISKTTAWLKKWAL